MNRELIYVPKDITEVFIKDFYKGIIQGHNRAIGLVSRL